MAEPDPPPSVAAASAAWRTSLDVEGQDAGHYPDHVNAGLLDMLAFAPRRALELGCAGGAFGAAVKARHPGAHVTGIEAGRAPAVKAATRIDRVIRARIEDIDFAAHGIAHGEIDTVIAADILEHVVNPWSVLERLKPFLGADAQFVASIPNVRNALLMAALAVNGRWQYRERGLLDITHLRFFTLHEIRLMFEETGYRLETWSANLSPPLAELFERSRGRDKVTLKLGRFTLADLDPDELREVCAEQLLVRARLA